METLPKDMFYEISKDMDIRDLINLCETNKLANKQICKNDDVWTYRLNKEFPNWKDFKINKSSIDIYIFLYQLKILKEKLDLSDSIFDLYKRIFYRIRNYKNDDIWYFLLDKYFSNWKNFKLDKSPFDTYIFLQQLNFLKKKLQISENIFDLYSKKELYLFGVRELPKEIANLTNLRKLSLSKSILTKIPKEIGKLTNLEELWLNYNFLSTLPKEIGNLSNLKTLSLYNNNWIEIPKEIGYLPKLETLLLTDKYGNKPSVQIPKEITDNKKIKIY